MNYYQMCHAHYGDLTCEATIARELLERHGKSTPQIVKELRYKTDMPMAECARMLRCVWRDMELERLQAENAKLRELVNKIWHCVDRSFSCYECRLVLQQVMRELGMEVDG